MNDIVAHGRTGETFRYHAIHGEEIPAEDTGWVLVVEGAHQKVAPHRLSAAEVLGDLRSMTIDEEHAKGSVQFFTEQMIESLDRRAEQLEAASEDAGGLRRRSSELRRELNEALEG